MYIKSKHTHGKYQVKHYILVEMYELRWVQIIQCFFYIFPGVFRLLTRITQPRLSLINLLTTRRGLDESRPIKKPGSKAYKSLLLINSAECFIWSFLTSANQTHMRNVPLYWQHALWNLTLNWCSSTVLNKALVTQAIRVFISYPSRHVCSYFDSDSYQPYTLTIAAGQNVAWPL